MNESKKTTLAADSIYLRDAFDVAAGNPEYIKNGPLTPDDMPCFVLRYFKEVLPRQIVGEIDLLASEILRLSSASSVHYNAKNIKNLLLRYLKMLCDLKKSLPDFKVILDHEPYLFLEAILNNRFMEMMDDETRIVFREYKEQLKQK